MRVRFITAWGKNGALVLLIASVVENCSTQQYNVGL